MLIEEAKITSIFSAGQQASNGKHLTNGTRLHSQQVGPKQLPSPVSQSAQARQQRDSEHVAQPQG